MPSFKSALSRYLEQVTVDAKHWQKEGQVQVRWEQKCGKEWSPKLPFSIFDREAVLGYSTKSERQKENTRFKTLITSAKKVIANGKNKKWARFKTRTSNELDLIGVGKNGKSIVLIEVKHGSTNASEIYYSPLQLLYYVFQWKNALESNDANQIISDINSLIKSKQSIGLLPGDAPILTKGTKISICPVIAVDAIKCSDEVKHRLQYVTDAINATTDNALKDLKIWEYPEGGIPIECRLPS